MVVVVVVVVVVVAVLPLHPAVVTSSSALPKAICDAPVKLSRGKCSQERLGRDCQRPAVKIFFLTRKTKNSIIL